MKIIGKYKNGNYDVLIYEDGTKIRFNNLPQLIPEFPESIDVKITDKCSVGCKFCYENSTKEGKHSDILEQSWIYSVHPFTELALNGNDLDHPQLNEFLEEMKLRNVIVNMTFKDIQFIKNQKRIDKFIEDDLIKGIGVSVDNKATINKFSGYSNLVIHTINGLLDKPIIKELKGYKVLILGYKNTGRGIVYKENNSKSIERNMKWLEENIINLLGEFKVCSFDNLAITQLNLEEQIKTKTSIPWENFYMGDDGNFSFYIDAVDKKFALNSTISKDKNYQIDGKTIDEMFKLLKK